MANQAISPLFIAIRSRSYSDQVPRSWRWKQDTTKPFYLRERRQTGWKEASCQARRQSPASSRVCQNDDCMIMKAFCNIYRDSVLGCPVGLYPPASVIIAVREHSTIVDVVPPLFVSCILLRCKVTIFWNASQNDGHLRMRVGQMVKYSAVCLLFSSPLQTRPFISFQPHVHFSLLSTKHAIRTPIRDSFHILAPVANHARTPQWNANADDLSIFLYLVRTRPYMMSRATVCIEKLM